jgi:hypothetical protein
MPMPLYVTPMLWDGDLNPEGAFEKFKHTVGHVELFAGFGQFIYKDFNPDDTSVSGDPFLLAWQIGATAKLSTNMNFKIAPVLYNYTGGNRGIFAGEGLAGLNVASGLGTGAFDQSGINNLLVLETPAEFNFKLGPVKTKLFGDFAYNIDGENRARAAAAAAHLPQTFTDETKAYMVGVAFGDLSKKHGYELRTWWQSIEQYATDVNLLDSDFFEGRGNMRGLGAGFAYAFTDAMVGAVRYGYADRINRELGTGGSNPDLPGLNPVRSYHILQLDLTYRF